MEGIDMKNIDIEGIALCSAQNCLKGTVPRDFRLLVFFMNQFPPSP
jgi:hypothetical protein